MNGDGYVSVLVCENAVDSETDFMPPDAGPIYCDYVKEWPPVAIDGITYEDNEAEAARQRRIVDIDSAY